VKQEALADGRKGVAQQCHDTVAQLQLKLTDLQAQVKAGQ